MNRLLGSTWKDIQALFLPSRELQSRHMSILLRVRHFENTLLALSELSSPGSYVQAPHWTVPSLLSTNPFFRLERGP